MKRVCLILVFLLLILSLAYATNPHIKNYSIADGLPTNKIFYVYQDSKDFMWFGTDVGVIRFDGINIIHFDMDDGLSDNLIIRIKEDNIGRLWFLNLNGTVNYYYKDKIYNESNEPLLKDLKTDYYIIDFFQDADSTLYFYNSISEVFVVENNELVDFRNFGFNNQNDIGLFLLDKSSENKFLLWTAPGIYEFSTIEDDLKLHKHTGIFQKAFKIDEHEYIALDRLDFLHLFKEDKVVKKNIFKSETQYINFIIKDKDNYLWLATYDKGVFCYKNDSLLMHLDIEKVQNIMIDHEKNIWVSSEKNGVFKINRDILKYTFLDQEKFDGIGITDITPSNDGNILATNGSSLYLIKGEQTFPFNLKIENENLDNIYQLKNNTVITNGDAGTEPYIIENVSFDKSSNTVHHDPYKKLNYRIKNIVTDSAEQRLFSYINDNLLVVEIMDNYICNFYNLKRGRIKNIFFNNKGDFFVNSSFNYKIIIDSIAYEKLKIESKIYLEELDEKTISSHLKLDANNELFNIPGNIIYLLNDTTFYEISKDLKMQIDYRIKNLAYDGSTLFFSTSKTVYFISNPIEIISGKQLELNRLNIEFNNINDILCQDSILYVASDDGLLLIPIEECVNSEVKIPEPYFYKVLLDDEDYNINSGIVEFTNHKRLSIEFASLNYSSFPSNYSYMLEGLDENWIQGDETRVVYLNLPPGNYSFKLKARTSTEYFSKIIELPVIVRPAFYQCSVTKLIAILLFLAIIFLIVRIYYKRKIKQKETDSLLITLEHKALQSMMNPHFIFNALGSIQKYLLLNKAEEASTYLSQFARLIRQNMNSLKSNLISIDDEVERLRNYMDLEKFRMNNKFDYTILVDEQIEGDEIGIPSMVIQPFVENAIWHGISSLPKDGKITVRFNLKDEKSIEIIIEDNGIGIKNSEVFSKSEHNLNMGVSITEKRLKLIGDKHNIESEIITEELTQGIQNPGTRIKISVPVLT